MRLLSTAVADVREEYVPPVRSTPKLPTYPDLVVDQRRLLQHSPHPLQDEEAALSSTRLAKRKSKR